MLLFVGNGAFKIPFTIMISAELLTVINFCRCVLVSCSCACVLFIVLCVGNLNISLMASWLCIVQGTKCLKEGKKTDHNIPWTTQRLILFSSLAA